MSENIDQFKTVTANPNVEEPVSIATPPPIEQTAQVPAEINLQRIDILRITGPLVVFFGPRDIGKTVTLLRLCNYVRSRYEIKPDQNFRTDNAYAETVRAFEAMLQSMQFAPKATGDINFLLLNVTDDGTRFCQFLESPGEHFFERTKANDPYPNYMNRILADDYKKIFVFFFEIDMFRSDQDLRNYSDKIARLIRDKVSSRRDQVIIVCNKSDIHPFYRGGAPIKSEYKKAIYNHPSFKGLKEALRNSGFRRVPFVVFSAGAFNDDGTGEKMFAPSADHFPKHLWQRIYESIQGRPWWKFW